MSTQHHPGRIFAFAILFLLLLLTIAAGPIGFAVLVMAGIPIAILFGFEFLAHSKSKPR
ncbi:MAG TPA: hypothetical protein VFH38_04735 [Jatrophihabitans sp.]|nr:hypothetical protein [Jatrophihabitans sp.]